jgi:uncharacterized membrane protein YqhA
MLFKFAVIIIIVSSIFFIKKEMGEKNLNKNINHIFLEKCFGRIKNQL